MGGLASLTSRRQGYRLHLDAEAHDCLVELLPPHLARRFRAIAGVPDPRFIQLDHQLNHLFTQESDQAVDFSVDRLRLRRILLSGRVPTARSSASRQSSSLAR